MNQSADPSVFDWSASRNAKRFVDDKMDRAIKQWMRGNLCKRFLTLPAGGWVWERNLAHMFPGYYTFDGVERNAVVHSRATALAAKLTRLTPGSAFRMSPRPTSLEMYLRYIQPEVGPYDMIYFDWMGTWSDKKMGQVRSLFGRRLFADNSYFRYTISMSRGRADRWEPLSEDAPRINYHDVRCCDNSMPLAAWLKHGVPHMICETARKNGYSASVVKAFVYLSHADMDSPGVTEATVLIKINKGKTNG